MADIEIDRNSPEAAKQVMDAQCSSLAEQKIALGQLLRSQQVAESFALGCSAVTLFDTGFRLNVGQVEVLTFFKSIVRMLVLGNISGRALEFGEAVPAHYQSVPEPHYIWIGSIESFEYASDQLERGHEEFVRAAALTPKGLPRRGTAFKRSHSLGLIDYARSLTSVEAFTASSMSASSVHFEEGVMTRVTKNHFERNPDARRECIKAKGNTCVICGFNFGAVYGPEANGLIHVHHLVPLSTIRESYAVNPAKDLVPVCPNCHAVIHLKAPPYSVEEVKAMAQRTAASDVRRD